MSAIELVMETGFAVTAFLSLILNLAIPEEADDDAVETTANTVDAGDDDREWERIQRPSQLKAMRNSEDHTRGSTDIEVNGGTQQGDVDKMHTIKDA
jgi:hypothetical protein